MQHELPGNKQRDPNLCLKTLAFYARMYGHDLQGYKSKIIFNLSGAKSSGRKKKKKDYPGMVPNTDSWKDY